MKQLSLLALLALAACGADGEPVQPTLNAHGGLGSSGGYVGGAVGLNKGPLSIYLGF
ncbi:hypothetical protein [Ruegeria hyattellae]|uniref:hypothetical protein n=1 Tax=Ruegeria hyattellae TaxID=3233337 RepID=UPI00355B42CD